MSKKDFRNTPAMQFIHTATNRVEEIVVEYEHVVEEKNKEDKIPAKVRYIEILSEANETKSKRVNLLIKPSLYKAVQLYADSKEISINEAIHSLLTHSLGK